MVINHLLDGMILQVPSQTCNIDPEKWWLGRLLSYWEANFSGVMLNFGGGNRWDR